MFANKVFLFIAFLATAAAYCPNGCSGHGSCGANGKFVCLPNKEKQAFLPLKTSFSSPPSFSKLPNVNFFLYY